MGDRLVTLTVALVVALAAVPARAVMAQLTGHLVLADSSGSSAEVVRFLREDRAWLASLPASLWQPAPPPESPEVRPWLRQHLAGWEGRSLPGNRAGREQPPGARDLLSLLRDRWLARGYLSAHFWRRPPPVAPASVPSPTAGASRASAVSGTPPPEPPQTLVVAPGPRFHLGKLVVEGKDFSGRDRLLRVLLPKAGDPFDAARWTDAIQNLLAGTGEHGYPFVRWLLRDVDVDTVRALLDVQAMLLPGVQAVIGPQTSNLPGGKGDAFLARASGLQPGSLFRESDLQRARQRLQQRGLYRRVGEPVVTLTGARDTVGIHWPVVPIAHPNRLAIVMGFNRNATGGVGRLSGQVDLLLANLAWTGRRLQAAWSDDGRARSHFGFGYLEPLALGTPLDAEIAVDHEVATDVYTRFQVDGRVRLPVVAAWGIEFGLGWDRSTFPVGPLERTRRVRARGAFLHRRFDPVQSGWEGVFALETAQRQAIARADTSEGSAATVQDAHERQRLLEVDLAGEVWLGRFWSLAARGAARQVTGPTRDIPLSEQYRFGGANTVRGYLEDEFHGDRVAYGSLELRIGPALGSRVYTFLDLGYFEFSALVPLPEDPNRRELRSGTMRGFGLGLRTGTPGGNISLAIGLPGTVSFEDAKLHVSLLEAF